MDFKQGLDARLIAAKPEPAKLLATICVSPIRLAFDFIAIRPAYERAVRLLIEKGFNEFTNYMLFNFNDTPRDPLRPADDRRQAQRRTRHPHHWLPDTFHPDERCEPPLRRPRVDMALFTRHSVRSFGHPRSFSPNPEFVKHAFGETYEQFLEILSMPDPTSFTVTTTSTTARLTGGANSVVLRLSRRRSC